MAKARTKSTKPQVKMPAFQGRPLRARYDAAQTTADNRHHWSNADALAPDAALTPDVRRTLRIRARYEIANNSYAKGIESSLVNYVIGIGPTLNVLLEDKVQAKEIEADFASWAKEIDFGGKLRTMRAARFHDGEAWALKITNRRLRHQIKLDLRLIEADQVETPNLGQRRQPVSGIVFDEFGNPFEYHILKDHPGSDLPVRFAEFVRVPAAQAIHWFVPTRPGENRPIPEITPALPVFADLRDFTRAVLRAAMSAAKISVVMETQAAGEEGPADVDPMVEMDLPDNTAIFAPAGWKASQIRAEQPSTTYPAYVEDRLREAGRCINMPLNLVLGSSKDMNYSSGKFDGQSFFRFTGIEQTDCELKVLDDVFADWFREARALYGIADETIPHQWDWPPMQPVDKQKEVSADIDLVEASMLSLKRYWERVGLDPDAEWTQIVKEAKERKDAGLPPRGAKSAPSAPPMKPEMTPEEKKQEEAANGT